MKTRVIHFRDSWHLMPDEAVYIGRYYHRYRIPASDWANPYFIGKDGTRDQVIEKYRQYLLGRPDLLARLHELKGKTLVCWCRPNACHGDVLAEMADAL